MLLEKNNHMVGIDAEGIHFSNGDIMRIEEKPIDYSTLKKGSLVYIRRFSERYRKQNKKFLTEVEEFFPVMEILLCRGLTGKKEYFTYQEIEKIILE